MKFKFLLIFLVFFGIFLFIPNKVNAVWYKYFDNPVIRFGNEGQFDSVRLGAPSVLISNSIYQIWYEGHNGSVWIIGHADSSDGISWKNSAPINIDLSSDPNSQNITDPFVLFDENKYKMWFTSSGINQTNMHIDYTTSSDGLMWEKPQIILTPEYDWEKGEGITSTTILHDTSGYKMLYTANGINGVWQIGYAFSENGISWRKNPIPVITASLPWEGGVVGNAHMIYTSTDYEVWYHALGGIGHAISTTDPTTWVKDPNPVITPSQDFDASRVLDPFVIKENDLYRMWYAGINGSGNWQIGYAQTAPITITPFPTDTPKPTVTPIPPSTPTPTETPKPTLTPTPTGIIPVILIPGMGASWNQRDMFSCNLSQSGNWTMAPYASPSYNRFIKTFINAGLVNNKNFFVYGYDWRQSVKDSGIKLKKFVDSLESQKVNIVSHSLGGLIGRSYIQQFPTDHKVNKFVTLGSPHEGTVIAYPVWENGEVWADDLVYKTAINLLINICRVTPPNYALKTKREVVHNLSPSVRDLLPTFDFIYKNNHLVTEDLLEGENPWLKNNKFLYPFNNISLLTVSGNDRKTIVSLKVRDAKPYGLGKNNWLDGEPFKEETTLSGDGTILNSSSLIDGSEQAIFPTDHVGLIKETEPIKKVLNFLGFASAKPAAPDINTSIKSKSVLSIAIDKPAELELVNIQTKSMQKSNSGIVAVVSDKPNTYQLKLQPQITGQMVLSVSQFGLSDMWKDYKLKVTKGKEKGFIFIYNPQNASQSRLIEL